MITKNDLEAHFDAWSNRFERLERILLSMHQELAKKADSKDVAMLVGDLATHMDERFNAVHNEIRPILGSHERRITKLERRPQAY